MASFDSSFVSEHVQQNVDSRRKKIAAGDCADVQANRLEAWITEIVRCTLFSMQHRSCQEEAATLRQSTDKYHDHKAYVEQSCLKQRRVEERVKAYEQKQQESFSRAARFKSVLAPFLSARSPDIPDKSTEHELEIIHLKQAVTQLQHELTALTESNRRRDLDSTDLKSSEQSQDNPCIGRRMRMKAELLELVDEELTRRDLLTKAELQDKQYVSKPELESTTTEQNRSLASLSHLSAVYGESRKDQEETMRKVCGDLEDIKIKTVETQRSLNEHQSDIVLLKKSEVNTSSRTRVVEDLLNDMKSAHKKILTTIALPAPTEFGESVNGKSQIQQAEFSSVLRRLTKLEEFSQQLDSKLDDYRKVSSCQNRAPTQPTSSLEPARKDLVATDVVDQLRNDLKTLQSLSQRNNHAIQSLDTRYNALTTDDLCRRVLALTQPLIPEIERHIMETQALRDSIRLEHAQMGRQYDVVKGQISDLRSELREVQSNLVPRQIIMELEAKVALQDSRVTENGVLTEALRKDQVIWQTRLTSLDQQLLSMTERMTELERPAEQDVEEDLRAGLRDQQSQVHVLTKNVESLGMAQEQLIKEVRGAKQQLESEIAFIKSRVTGLKFLRIDNVSSRLSAGKARHLFGDGIVSLELHEPESKYRWFEVEMTDPLAAADLTQRIGGKKMGGRRVSVKPLDKDDSSSEHDSIRIGSSGDSSTDDDYNGDRGRALQDLSVRRKRNVEDWLRVPSNCKKRKIECPTSSTNK